MSSLVYGRRYKFHLTIISWSLLDIKKRENQSEETATYTVTMTVVKNGCNWRLRASRRIFDTINSYQIR